MIKFILSIFMLLITFNLNSFIYRIDILQNAKGQKIFLLGDIHEADCEDDYFENIIPKNISDIQAKQLINIIKKNYNSDKNLIISEDIYSKYEGEAKILEVISGIQLFEKNKTSYTFMNYLMLLAIDNSINTINIEFRQILATLRFLKVMLQQEICNEIKENNQILKEYETILKIFKEINNQINSFKQSNIINKLIDARIIHYILKNPNIDNIFVAAGGGHTEPVTLFLLKESDYKLVDHIILVKNNNGKTCKPINLEIYFSKFTNKPIKSKL